MIIPTLGETAQLERCLEAVSRQNVPDLDIVVVDNAPGSASTRHISAKWGARYVEEPIRGVSRARNTGARESTRELVAYTDDDGVPEPGWVEALTREFDDPRVVAVAGRTLPLRVDTESEKLSARLRRSAYDRPFRLSLDRDTPAWFPISAFGGVGGGMNMAFRRSIFDRWEGFNERLGRGTLMYGGEEQYAFFSFVKMGYKVVYTPDAVVRHPFPETMDELRQRYLRDLTASTAYFSMLIAEEDGHRAATLKYVAEALVGTQRPWRGARPPRTQLVSFPQKLQALVLGPLRYAQSRRVQSDGSVEARSAKKAGVESPPL